MNYPPTPPEQLVEHLRALREMGYPWPRAWELAYRKLRWPNDTDSRREWKAALEAVKDEWRAAYNGEPTAISATVANLALLPSDHVGRAVRLPPTQRISTRPPKRDSNREAFVA